MDGVGVQGHQGMGFASWCLQGWMSEPSGGGTWGIQKHVRQSVVPNAGDALDINIGFGALGHLGNGLTGWCL